MTKKCLICNKTLEKDKKGVAFCKKDNSSVNYICEDCIQIFANDLFAQSRKEMKDTEFECFQLKNPKEIFDKISENVIGQDYAKKVLSVAVYNHYKRVLNQELNIEKNNIFLAGPSGSGKTFLAKTLAEILKVPFVICDATSLTESGYVGEDVESVITKLYQNANGDIDMTEIGIVYIDEIDKIAKKDKNPSITRDVSGEGVQNALLKLIEGTIINVPTTQGRINVNTEYVQIDTSNILFICGGAFADIESKDEQKEKRIVGFGEQDQEKEEDFFTKKNSLSEKYINYGMTREFMGRLSVIAELQPLDKNDLIDVLKKSNKSLLYDYIALFAIDGIQLEFEDEALEEIVKIALERNLGARGLKSILEEVMLNLMFELPSMKDVGRCVVTKDTVLDGNFHLKKNICLA